MTFCFLSCLISGCSKDDEPNGKNKSDETLTLSGRTFVLEEYTYDLEDNKEYEKRTLTFSNTTCTQNKAGYYYTWADRWKKVNYNSTTTHVYSVSSNQVTIHGYLIWGDGDTENKTFTIYENMLIGGDEVYIEK